MLPEAGPRFFWLGVFQCISPFCALNPDRQTPPPPRPGGTPNSRLAELSASWGLTNGYERSHRRSPWKQNARTPPRTAVCPSHRGTRPEHAPGVAEASPYRCLGREVRTVPEPLRSVQYSLCGTYRIPCGMCSVFYSAYSAQNRDSGRNNGRHFSRTAEILIYITSYTCTSILSMAHSRANNGGR